MIRAIIVHGGAGVVPENLHSEHEQGIRRACAAGRRILQQDGSAVEAVVAAIKILEDDHSFNAGTGSVLNEAGYVELDAGLMEGRHLQIGSVAAVRDVANPIEICQRLLDSPYNFFAGEDAARIADDHGIRRIDPALLITPRRRRRWERGEKGVPLDTGLAASDTVGAVALDGEGLLACGTSTGGISGKPRGRIGDSPLPGGGFYADCEAGACSTTGLGEALARILAARRAVSGLEARLSAQQAAQNAIEFLSRRIPEASGGLILLSAAGDIGIAYNSPGMTHAWWHGDRGEHSGF